jgi:diguanylate cyclase (GGDEF)-like protein
MRTSRHRKLTRFSALASAALLLLLSVLAVPASAAGLGGGLGGLLPGNLGGGFPSGGGSQTSPGLLPGLLPGVNLPGVSLPGVNLPGVTVPGGQQPGGTLPGGTLPGGTLPGGTLPGGNLPGGTLPGGTLPGGLPGTGQPNPSPGQGQGGGNDTKQPAGDDTRKAPANDQRKAPVKVAPVSPSPDVPAVDVPPADGQTTSTGEARPAPANKNRARAAAAHLGVATQTKGSFELTLPQHQSLTGSASSDSRGSRSNPPADSLAARAFEQIPQEYRWPVFVFACLAVFFAMNTMRERSRTVRMHRRALTASLTGLSNRAAFERSLAREYRRADRYDRPLSLLLVDLDGFKEINDTRGHAAGDEVLRKAADVLAGRVRREDMAARLGGDEFVVLCPETSVGEASKLASDLEGALAEASIKSSIGFAERELEDEGMPEYLVARADASMYHRKQRSSGRKERRRSRAKGHTQPALAGA